MEIEEKIEIKRENLVESEEGKLEDEQAISDLFAIGVVEEESEKSNKNSKEPTNKEEGGNNQENPLNGLKKGDQTSNELKPLSKNALKKMMRKATKKLAQGVKTLTKMEGLKKEELFSDEPTKHILLVHFGVGTEDDFNTISDFIQTYQRTSKEASTTAPKIDVFPGYLHGFLEFQDEKEAELFINHSGVIKMKFGCSVWMKELEYKSLGDNKALPRPRYTFFFYSKLPRTSIKAVRENKIPDAQMHIDVPGLIVKQDFVSPEEEKQLLEAIDSKKWNKLSKRRVQHYGYEFIYGKNKVDPDKFIGPLPDFLEPSLGRLNEICSEINKGEKLDQLTINEYFPGQGIPPHVDSHSPFKEAFGVICLGSGVVMSFKSHKAEVRHLYLPRRSAYILSGEIRYAWFHSIAERKLDRVEGGLKFRRRRVSLTFRTVSRVPCTCDYPIFCDSRGFNQATFKWSSIEGTENPEGEEQPKLSEEDLKLQKIVEEAQTAVKKTQIETQYVHEVYERIAVHFSHTRYKPWPQVVKFLSSLEKHSIVADVGCGNGKYLNVDENLVMIGTDITHNLLKICVDRGGNVFRADGLNLPVKSNSVDAAISIAVIHHFSNPLLRKQAVEELLRIVRPGGRILVTVWALEQSKNKNKGFDGSSQDVFVPWNLAKVYHKKNVDSGLEEKGLTEDEEKVKKRGDVYVDPGKQSVVYKRYYHLFCEGELDGIVGEIEGGEVVETFWDRDNWCCVARKKTVEEMSA